MERYNWYGRSVSRPRIDRHMPIGIGKIERSTSSTTVITQSDGRGVGVYGASRYGRCVYGSIIGLYGSDTYGNCVYAYGEGVPRHLITVIRRVTAAYTAVANDDEILCDTDGGAITVTLPAGILGRRYRIVNVGTSNYDVTVDGDGSETIFGSTTLTLADGEAVDICFESVEGWW